MRTTLTIDDDVLDAVKERARREKRTAGEVLSDLARQALNGTPVDVRDEDPEADEFERTFGFRPLPRRPGVIVTNEMIDRLREDGPY